MLTLQWNNEYSKMDHKLGLRNVKDKSENKISKPIISAGNVLFFDIIKSKEERAHPSQ